MTLIFVHVLLLFFLFLRFDKQLTSRVSRLMLFGIQYVMSRVEILDKDRILFSCTMLQENYNYFSLTIIS